MKELIGVLFTIAGIAVGVFIGYEIMSTTENGLGMILLFACPLLGGILGAKIGIEIGESLDSSVSKNTNKKDVQPKNVYEQALPLARQMIIDGYRRIARERNIAPTLRISDEKIMEIYKRVRTAFNEAAKQRKEHIPAVYLNFIVLKFFQVYETGGDMFLNEHLQYEVGKYLNEGLRQEYKQELKLF